MFNFDGHVNNNCPVPVKVFPTSHIVKKIIFFWFDVLDTFDPYSNVPILKGRTLPCIYHYKETYSILS